MPWGIICGPYLDYDLFLKEIDITPEQMEAAKQAMPQPLPSPEISVKESPIEGLGVFTKRPYVASAFIGVLKRGEEWTELGRYINHSPNSNAAVHGPRIYASVDIHEGDEVTVNYREVKANG